MYISGNYMYLESTRLLPNDRAYLISPQIPQDGSKKCLQFSFNMFGRELGKLAVLDANGNELWFFDGKHTGDWRENAEEIVQLEILTVLILLQSMQARSKAGSRSA